MKVGVGVTRLDARCLLKEADGQVPLPLNHVDDAEVVVGEELVRVCVKLYFELRRGVVETRRAVLQKVSEAEVVVRAREVRVECDGPFELVNRFGQEGGLAVCATEDDM